MSVFKVPDTFAQDLQVIQDILSAYKPPIPPVQPVIAENDDDEVASSCGSQDEIMDLVKDTPVVSTAIPVSDSDSSDTDSSDDDEPQRRQQENAEPLDCDDEEDAGPASTAQTYHGTVNEVIDPEVSVPDVEEVAADEILEKVGEVLNILDKMVIIKGLPTGVVNRGTGQSRALDADTLLVFEDRKVLGYVHEIFGPTTEPMYQVKFNSAQHIDRDKIRISRPVYHMPRCSRFVFVTDVKGSDASNWNDEEPPECDQEFSDDEAEAAFKRNAKNERRARSQSVVSSRRGGSPTPSARMDDLPYDPYDSEPGAGPSRPAPIPYDADPYSETFFGGEEPVAGQTMADPVRVAPGERPPRLGNVRGLLRGKERGNRRGRDSGRRGGRHSSGAHPPPTNGHEPYDPSKPSFAAAAAPFNPQFNPQFAPMPPMQPYSQPVHMQGSPPQGYGQGQPPWPNQQQPVMPHINPLFASAFAISYGYPYPPYQNHHNPPGPQWGSGHPGQ